MTEGGFKARIKVSNIIIERFYNIEKIVCGLVI